MLGGRVQHLVDSLQLIDGERPAGFGLQSLPTHRKPQQSQSLLGEIGDGALARVNIVNAGSSCIAVPELRPLAAELGSGQRDAATWPSRAICRRQIARKPPTA